MIGILGAESRVTETETTSKYFAFGTLFGMVFG